MKYVFITFEQMKIDENCQRTSYRNWGQGIERWRHFRSGTPPSGQIYIFANYAKTIMDRRKMSVEHLKEIGVGELNGDVASGLRRQLAAEFTFSQNPRKMSKIDENCQ
jgi:hypothetical protein